MRTSLGLAAAAVRALRRYPGAALPTPDQDFTAVGSVLDPSGASVAAAWSALRVG